MMEDHLEKECDGHELKKCVTTPFPKDHRPELDLTEELWLDDASLHQTCTGGLHRMVELGWMDMTTKASLLASQLAMSRVGHLEVACHLCVHLTIEHDSCMVLDPTHPNVDLSQFKECDWKGFCGEAKEAKLTNATPPCGKEVDIHMFVDSGPDGDEVTRRSMNKSFIFLNVAPIAWDSKKQKRSKHQCSGMCLW